jgi:radical SAM protein with 4Fe4S-binding SPASM domain
VWRSRRELEAALDRIALEAGEAIAARIRSPLAYRRDACGCALGRHLHVRSDGTLFGCFRMEEPIGRLEDGLVSTLARLREHPRRASTTPICCDCPLVTLCGGGCRSDNVLFTGDGDTPLCGPWRVRVLSELLFADEVSALEWSTLHLAEEARRRGVDAPDTTRTRHPSLHVR